MAISPLGGLGGTPGQVDKIAIGRSGQSPLLQNPAINQIGVQPQTIAPPTIGLAPSPVPVAPQFAPGGQFEAPQDLQSVFQTFAQNQANGGAQAGTLGGIVPTNSFADIFQQGGAQAGQEQGLPAGGLLGALIQQQQQLQQGRDLNIPVPGTTPDGAPAPAAPAGPDLSFIKNIFDNPNIPGSGTDFDSFVETQAKLQGLSPQDLNDKIKFGSLVPDVSGSAGIPGTQFFVSPGQAAFDIAATE